MTAWMKSCREGEKEALKKAIEIVARKAREVLKLQYASCQHQDGGQAQRSGGVDPGRTSAIENGVDHEADVTENELVWLSLNEHEQVVSNDHGFYNGNEGATLLSKNLDILEENLWIKKRPPISTRSLVAKRRDAVFGILDYLYLKDCAD